ncbi:MAG: 50S ribosomal protein L18Ae [archaeon]
MKTYEAKGTFTKKGENQKFTTTLTAENEKMANEKIFAQMGSKQNIKRPYIKIDSIKETK